MSDRMILLNPGPVTLSDRVRQALTRGDWCHREPEFAVLTREILKDLLHVHPSLSGDFDAVLLTGSGTAAVEAMLASFAPTHSRTLVIANGVYGERMARMLELHGKPSSVLAHAWTEPVNLPALQRALQGDSSLTHVAVVHHETTTGRLNDLEAIGRICKSWGAHLLVDAVSSFGAEHLDAEWNIAAVAGAANKCLHGVPGLSFVLVRRERWSSPVRVGSLYLDLFAWHKAQRADGFSPFTQAVQAAFALREALLEHREQGGWEARRELFRSRATQICATLHDAGVETLLPPAEYSSVLRSYRLPAGISYPQLHDALKHKGFVIYAGQGQLATKIFRIAHMGDIREPDMQALLRALRATLAKTNLTSKTLTRKSPARKKPARKTPGKSKARAKRGRGASTSRKSPARRPR